MSELVMIDFIMMLIFMIIIPCGCVLAVYKYGRYYERLQRNGLIQKRKDR